MQRHSSQAPTQDYRTNDRIRAREVRLIDEDGTQLGIVGSREALELARSKELDLIEVAPTANPPVCKIMDYGRYKYEQAKKDREAQKKSKAVEVKGVRLRPRIDDHDYMVRVRDAAKFLKEGDKVKVTVIFKSREINHPEIARRLLEKMIVDTADVAVVEKPPALEARTMTMFLSPKPGVEKKEKDAKEAKAAASKPEPKADAAPEQAAVA